jgi:hypothetical protein
VFVPEVLCRYRWHGKSMTIAETHPDRGTLVLDMSMRHPWLELS